MSSDNRINQDSGVPNIIEADKFMAMTIDDISLSLVKLIDLSTKNQQTLSSLLDYTIKNEKRLASIQNELIEEADEGEFITKLDTVTTTEFAFINTVTEPGHPVKGYAVSNDGPNTIYVAHNAIKRGMSPDAVDVASDISRFQQVLSGEEIRFIFNRRRVYNVAILARDGDSIYRLWLTW